MLEKIDLEQAKIRILNYNKKNVERKILKRKRSGTIKIPCPNCKHKKIWKNGFSKYKKIKYNRYKCPSCKKEFQRGRANA